MYKDCADKNYRGQSSRHGTRHKRRIKDFGADRSLKMDGKSNRIGWLAGIVRVECEVWVGLSVTSPLLYSEIDYLAPQW